MRKTLVLVAGIALGAAAGSCGDDEKGCPGVVCNNCATDCDANCSENQTEVCVSLAQFGGSEDLRCTYCQ
jgi:hypothetical protein